MEEEPARTLVPVPPEERPHRRRRTARVLLVADGRLLLFADSDPGLPGSRWWITPGGGIDPGESDREAAVRELREETGLGVTEPDLVGPVLVRPVVHGYTDVVIEQEDVFFACWVPRFDVSHDGHTAEERRTMTHHHWWSDEELGTTAEEVWPTDLLALWRAAVSRRDAAMRGETMPPLVGAAVEESTVPV